MLRMIDRHAVQQMLTAGVRIREVARHFEVSRRTIERIRKEPAVEGAEGAVAHWKRGVGPPPVPATVRERMRALIAEDPGRGKVLVLDVSANTLTPPRWGRCPQWVKWHR